MEKKYGYMTTDGSVYRVLLENAKENRKYATTAEAMLWEMLRRNNLGERFRRQHSIGNYIPDFVCLKKRLIIEVDGGYHHLWCQAIDDRERDNNLRKLGYTILRFSNEEVLHQIKHVIQIIKDNMERNNVNNSSQLNPCGTPLLWRGGGRLLIFSAPSGSGKSTIIGWLMKEHHELNLTFSISCTSRAPRGTEQNGVEYFFVTPDEFRERIARDEFLEYEEVYENRFYGTLKEQVERQREKGQNVMFDVDVKGGVNIKRHYADEALSIFIQPPSVEELRRRLVNRATDAPEVIEQRVNKAAYELTFAPQFDHVVVNDDLQKACQEVYRLVCDFVNHP